MKSTAPLIPFSVTHTHLVTFKSVSGEFGRMLMSCASDSAVITVSVTLSVSQVCKVTRRNTHTHGHCPMEKWGQVHTLGTWEAKYQSGSCPPSRRRWTLSLSVLSATTRSLMMGKWNQPTHQHWRHVLHCVYTHTTKLQVTWICFWCWPKSPVSRNWRTQYPGGYFWPYISDLYIFSFMLLFLKILCLFQWVYNGLATFLIKGIYYSYRKIWFLCLQIESHISSSECLLTNLPLAGFVWCWNWRSITFQNIYRMNASHGG